MGRRNRAKDQQIGKTAVLLTNNRVLLHHENAKERKVETGIEVSVPANQRDAIDTMVRRELDGPATGLTKSP